jgi:uncharacterized protein with NAD-binding domain and iron-sulfur cluster
MADKKKVAILGAGPAGLAAAFGLTATPALREAHEVTIYQMGWRAGGKCASGREGAENRVDQNGTHYLFGCYDNTLDMARVAYAELAEAKNKDFGSYKSALLPRDLLALKHFFRGKWRMWAMPLPANEVAPGTQPGRLRPGEYLMMAFQALLYMILGVRIGHYLRPPAPFDQDRPTILVAIYAVLNPVFTVLGWILWAIGLALVRLTVDLLRLLGDPDFLFIAKMLAGFRWLNNLLFARLAKRFVFVFRLYVLVDFATTVGIALLRDRVPAEGLSAIEQYEFRAWIAHHGAQDLTLYAPFVSTWYDAVAAFEDGDLSKPNLSAGVSMMAIGMALMNYKGHFAYQMRSEIGDTLIGPVYEVLRARGVTFKFFHKVRDVVPGAGDLIEEIVIEQQVKAGDDYQPFKWVKGLKVWPNAPLWDQIEGPQPGPEINLESFYTPWRGQTLPALKRGVDFDEVVLAIPVGALPTYCAKLVANSEKWQDMTTHLTGVETQTMRLFFSTSLDEMGWSLPTPILSNYALPFATWEDNGELIAVQTWPEDQTPKSIATLFGPLPAAHIPPPETDHGYPARQDKTAKDNAKRFLEENIGALWPKAATLENPLSVNWDTLIDLEGRKGEARFEGQLVRANAGPLERYTTARAGTAQHRIAPDDSGYSNMMLAGDWTGNHFLIGSIEGAIMSGYQASRAISGAPEFIPGEDAGL